MKRTFLLLSLFVVLAAQGQDKALAERIRKVENSLSPTIIYGDSVIPVLTLEQQMRAHHARGLSIAVLRNNKIEWAKGYGWADSATGRKVTTDTRFQAASISKSMNSLALLKLVQQGKIDPKADINTYLKGWTFPYDSLSKGKKITLYNLLSHTAGLTVHGFPGYERTDSIPTIFQILDGKRPANNPPIRSAFEPGLRFEYSGGGTTLSQLMLTSVTGRKYEEFMKKEVLVPMGMTHSSFDQPTKDTAELATGYHTDGRPVPGKYHIYPEQAAAGLWTTPSDLCRYITEVNLSMNGRSSKVLSPEMMRTRLTSVIDSNFGLGVFLTKRGGYTWFSHSGGNEAFLSLYYGNPATGDGMAIMINGEDFGVINELFMSLCRVYGWEGFFKPEFRKTIKPLESELKSMTGRYVSGKDTINAVVRDGGLVFESLTRPGVLYTPKFADDDHFWLWEDESLKCTLARDERKRVKSIEFRRDDDKWYWNRMD
jgi:CubicO group peptidase (beta-lactamase class C family)